MYNDLQWTNKNPTNLSNAIKLIQVNSFLFFRELYKNKSMYITI